MVKLPTDAAQVVARRALGRKVLRAGICAFLSLAASFWALPSIALVDMRNANYSETWLDVSFDNDADGIARTYNSRTTFDGLFGFGWCSDLESTLEIAEDGGVLLTHCGAGYMDTYRAVDYKGRLQTIKLSIEKIADGVEKGMASEARSVFNMIAPFDRNSIETYLNDLITRRGGRGRQEIMVLAQKFGVASLPRNALFVGAYDRRKTLEITEKKISAFFEGVEIRRFNRGLQLIGYRHGVTGLWVTLKFSGTRLTRIEPATGRGFDVETTAGGKIQSIRRDDGSEALYKYDNTGNLVSVKDAWGGEYHYEYNDKHDFTRATWSDKTSIYVGYDRHGFVISYTDRDGCTEDYAYEDISYPNEYRSRVIKQCESRIVAENLYEFFLSPVEGKKFFSRIRTIIGGVERDVFFDSVNTRPIKVRYGKSGTSLQEASYQYDDKDRLAAREVLNWREEFIYFDTSGKGIREVRRLERKPNGQWVLLGIVSVEREAGGRILSGTDFTGERVELETWGPDGQLATMRVAKSPTIHLKWTDSRGREWQVEEVAAEGIGVISAEDGNFSNDENIPLASISNDPGKAMLWRWLQAGMRIANPLWNLYYEIPEVPSGHVERTRGQLYGDLFSARGRGDFAGSLTVLEKMSKLAASSKNEESLNLAQIAIQLALGSEAHGDNATTEGLWRLAIYLFELRGNERAREAMLGLATWMVEKQRFTEASALARTLQKMPRIEANSSRDVLIGVQLLHATLLERTGRPFEALEILTKCRESGLCTGKGSSVADRRQADELFSSLLAETGSRDQFEQLVEDNALSFEISSLFLRTTGKADQNTLRLASWLGNAGRESAELALLQRERDAIARDPAVTAGWRVSLEIRIANAAIGLSQFDVAASALRDAKALCAGQPADGQPICANELAELEVNFADAIGQRARAMSLYESAGLHHRAEFSSEFLDTAALYVRSGDIARARESILRAQTAIVRESDSPPEHWRRANLDSWQGHIEAGSQGGMALLAQSADVLAAQLGESHWRSIRGRLWLAESQRILGDKAAADASVRRAFLAAQTTERMKLRAEASYRYAQLLADGGDYPTAIYFGKQAITIIQGFIAAAGSVNVEFSWSVGVDNYHVFRDVAGWLMREGRIGEAERIIAVLREREISDLERGGEDATAATEVKFPSLCRGPECEAEAEQRKLQGWLAQNERQAQALAKDTATRADERARVALEGGQLQLSWERFIKQLPVALMGGGSSVEDVQRTADRLDDETLALSEVLDWAGPNTMALRYLVLKDGLYLMALRGTERKVVAIPVTEHDLNREIGAFRQAIMERTCDVRKHGQKLYDWLIKPVEPQLLDWMHQSHDPVLLIAPDRNLGLVPFAALYDGKRYLVQAPLSLVWINEAVTQNLKLTPHKARGRAFGVSEKSPGFGALPHVPAELEAVTRIFESDPPFLNTSFTTSKLRQTIEGNRNVKGVSGPPPYPIIHIASHFRFEPGDEFKSGLLVGSLDGTETDQSNLLLSLFRIKQWRFTNTELLTLSACQTAESSIGVPGMTLRVDGFGPLAQKRGAHAVLASLWTISDRATGQLMESFYELRYGGHASGISKAAALKQAQLEMLGTVAATDRCDSGTRDLAHPYYWAPLVLMGNWQ